MEQFSVGSLVRCREREWIVLPSDMQDVLLLRPLGGSEAEVCGIYLPLEGNSVRAARFDPPAPDRAGDFETGRLLRDAARLSLRSGAGPFRSLGRLGARPRPYQLVPLIMALRLQAVRLLIADDVGIGKTVEAGLIVREMLDRGEIRRLAVLCPPHLCDQWQHELNEKFSIDAVIVRSSTAAGLERRLPHGDVSIFDHHPFTVVSIDYIKSDRHRATFMRSCPELVIVDEAHTATSASRRGKGQQQRHDLVREIAEDPDRHLLLLTATPHSGIEDNFLSLLALLKPHFATLDLQRLSEQERDQLARHFVQRRRADVKHWLGEDTPFPVRESSEATYSLARSPEYRRLFDDVYDFARELVRDQSTEGNGRAPWRARVRYWAALALLRCVMSSPAAAQKALAVRAGIDRLSHDELEEPELEQSYGDELFGDSVYDRTEQEAADDLEPGQVLEEGSPRSERGRLLRFASRAAELRGRGDPKLQRARAIIEDLLRDGFNPIIYCRYVETAKYVAEELKGLKGFRDLDVRAVTGEQTEEERETVVAELSESPRRILVATDCLSEGINLQHAFDAVLHYDLPWNPNRLEQREGRVDRYGQSRETIRVVLLYGQDNEMDEAVMRVLLRKAARIHRTLGITVPLPVDSGTVVDSLIATLFRPDARARQLSFADLGVIEDADRKLEEIDLQWDRAVEREKESRTRFAQRSIKPGEVQRELEESDAILGSPETVSRFVRAACERLGTPLVAAPPAAGRDVWRLAHSSLPQPVRERLEPLLQRARGKAADELLITFDGPAPEGIHIVGRNHPLVAGLADYLLEVALAPAEATPESLPAARSSMIRSTAVDRRTVLLLLRVRMLIRSAGESAPALAEELVVCGYRGRPGSAEWLDEKEAMRLLEEAQPGANVDPEERRTTLERVVDEVMGLEADLRTIAVQRARKLDEAHYRVREATRKGRAHVEPHLPPDLLGVYLIMPVPRGPAA